MIVFRAFSRAISQMDEPRFRAILFKGVGLSVLLLAVATWLLSWLLGWVLGDSITLPFIGQVGWLDEGLQWSFVAVMLLGSVFLLVPIASAIISVFLEDVAQTVEDKHYPGLPAATPVPIADQLRDASNFMIVLVVANLLALVLYLILAPLAPLIFWVMNGFLLGREYFTVAAMRRVGRTEAKAMRKRHSGTVWIAGILMAIPLSIPLVNLVIPILGVATFTHIFHLLERANPSD